MALQQRLAATAPLLAMMLALGSAASAEEMAQKTTLGTTIGTTLAATEALEPGMATTIGTTIGMTLSPQVVGGSDVGLALANRLDLFVMPFLKEGHLNDTAFVEGLLGTLGKKAELVKAQKAALDKSDTALDACLLQENYTLHAWKDCNATREGNKNQSIVDCNARDGADVSTYIIGESPTLDGIDYAPNDITEPEATCDFLTGKLDGTEYPCDAFVEDIRGAARAKYESDQKTWSAAEKQCSYSTDAYGNSVSDCASLGRAHRYQEEICLKNATAKKVVMCKLETALSGKCTIFSSITTSLTDLAEQEEKRNKEFRTVSMSRCLFMKYSAQKGTCFGTSVFSDCEKEVNGASEEYASNAAEQIHGYREEVKNSTIEWNCEPMTFTVGVNGVAYEKSNPSDEFSYYVETDPLTLSVSPAGEFSPDVCAGY